QSDANPANKKYALPCSPPNLNCIAIIIDNTNSPPDKNSIRKSVVTSAAFLLMTFEINTAKPTERRPNTNNLFLLTFSFSVCILFCQLFEEFAYWSFLAEFP